MSDVPKLLLVIRFSFLRMLRDLPSLIPLLFVPMLLSQLVNLALLLLTRNYGLAAALSWFYAWGLDGLTPRENDVVELVAQGCSNREIAEQLFISEGTARNILSVVLDKLGVRDRTQLAIRYWRRPY